jgi:hypothetical protein
VRAWHGGFELKAFATAVAISFAGFGGRVIRAAINDSDSTGDIPARRQPFADDMIHEWTPLPVCGQLETVDGATHRRGSGQTKTDAASGPGDDPRLASEPRTEAVAGKKCGASPN